MRESPAIIVGAGPAGLSSAAALQAEGIDAVILDQDDGVGASWRRRYQNLTLHTVRQFSGLAHRSMPRSYPNYVPRDLFVSYLEDYARHFDLRIEHGCRVRRIKREKAGPRFRIETNDGVWHSRVVVVATGHNGTPIRSSLPGQGSFHGTLIHSEEYDTPAAFRDGRVLVVGAGNSGSEIAADLARHGSGHVAISIRTPPPVVPRDVLKSPVQVVGILLSPLPAGVADRIAGVVARLAMGDLTRYGLQKPGWQPFTARRPPTIDTGFVEQVKQGRIEVRPAVAEVTPAGVRYVDGNEESFDHVIMATGFSTGLRTFLDLDGLLRDDEFPLHRCGEETSEPGLYFMGYTETHRGHLFEVKRDSLKLAKKVRTYLHREMKVNTRARQRRPIYVESRIRAPIDRVWDATQQPDQHQRWDARFGRITYLPRVDGEPQRFTYATTVVPGVTIAGTGESLGDRDRSDGTRWSGLKFWATDRRSIIDSGAGYWRYIPGDDGVRFLTRYNYRPRWGHLGELIDRWAFRPLFGWATAWSFDRLRLWLENGTPPEQTRNRAIAHAAAIAGLAGVFAYQGLVPKLWKLDGGEVAIWQGLGVPPDHAQRVVRTVGAVEAGLAVATVAAANKRWPFVIALAAMPTLVIGAAKADRSILTNVFNPGSLGMAVAALAGVALATTDGRPSGRRPLRRAPDRQPDVGDLP